MTHVWVMKGLKSKTRSSASTAKKISMKRKRNQKRKKVIDDGGEDDRISNLPDSILHEILSSMENLNSAVQTCVLSKRWRYVWTSLPNLHFYFDRFPFPKTASFAGVKRKTASCAGIKRLRFAHFVNQFLSLRDNNSSVCRFFFSPCNYVDPSLIKKCICYASRHNVQQLHVLANCFPRPFQFPSSFINSESLKVLKLVNCFRSVPLNKPLRLPALKTLHLHGFPDGSASFITKTVGNSLNLETLILEYLQLKSFNITAPQLRRLELCYRGHCVSETYESKIVVTAPRLTSFKLKGNVSPVFSTAILPCLDDVYVDLWFPFDPIIEQRMPLNVINMFRQLREANSVSLSLETLEILAMDIDSLKSHPSPFHKLKHLKLIDEMTCPTSNLPPDVITYLTQGSSMVTPWL